MVLCLLVASVGHGDEGGGWRDRVTLIASERLRGEVVDWFRPRPGAAEPEASRYAFVASQLRASETCPTTRACRLPSATSGPARSTSRTRSSARRGSRS